MKKKKQIVIILASLLCVVGLVFGIRAIKNRNYSMELIEESIRNHYYFLRDYNTMWPPKVVKEIESRMDDEEKQEIEHARATLNCEREVRNVKVISENTKDADELEDWVKEYFGVKVNVTKAYCLRVSCEEREKYDLSKESPYFDKYKYDYNKETNGKWSEWEENTHELEVYKIGGKWYCAVVDPID